MSTATVDLTTLAAFINWLKAGDPSAEEKVNMQKCITAASIYWLSATGRRLGNDGSSPFVQQVAYDEIYDGPGNARLFVRNPPIRSITSLTVNGIAVLPSTGFGVGGVVIDQSGKSIAIRTGRVNARMSTGRFAEGIANVELVSMCGFDGVPPDVGLAVNQMVAVNYKRRQWVDQSSQAMAAGAGTISFRDWELPPEVVRVIDFYSRTAVVY